MRHPLADAAEADDAERHVARAVEFPGRQVVPVPGLDVAVVRHDIAHQREREGERMRRHLAHAVIRRIGDPDAVARAGVRVDRVEARADAAYDAELWQRRDDALGDRRVLEQHAGAIARGGDHLVLGLALCRRKFDTRALEHGVLDIEIGEFVVGEQDARHGGATSAGRTGKRENGTCGGEIGQAA